MANLLHLFARDEILPSYWPNALQRRLSAAASQLKITKQNSTTLQVVAGAGDDLVACDIKGLWRYVEATVTASHPGGAAATYDIYLTCANQNIVGSPAPNTDSTNYAFAMQIKATGTPPTIVAGTVDQFRKVGTVGWDGTAITEIFQTVGMTLTPGALPIGAVVAYVGAGDPALAADGTQWLLADGRLISKTTYAGFFARAAHAYNLGVDPGGGNCRIPDKRGRGLLGADDMLGTRLVGVSPGAASRITVANKLLGQNGGSERVTLAALESGTNGNGRTNNDDVAHQHASHAHPGGATIDGGSFYNVAGIEFAANTGSAVNLHQHPLVARGADSAHQNLHPYEVDNMIVRVA